MITYPHLTALCADPVVLAEVVALVGRVKRDTRRRLLLDHQAQLRVILAGIDEALACGDETPPSEDTPQGG